MANKNVQMQKKSKRKEGLKEFKDAVSKQWDNTSKTLTSFDAKKPITSVAKAIGYTLDSLKQAGKGAVGLAKAVFNHQEWYLKDPNLTQGLIGANFGLNKRVPLPVNGRFNNTYNNQGTTYYNQHNSAVSAVGIETFLTIPQTEANDWEQSLQFMYSSIRAANSGAINYSVYDLEKYVVTVRSLHAAVAMLARAYRVLNAINKYDANTPKSYFAAMHLDYDTFSANAANLKEFYYKFAHIVEKLYPLEIDLLARTRWMFGNIFRESDDIKATAYIFSASHLPYFSSSSVGYTTSYSDALTATQTGATYSSVVNAFTTMLNTIGAYNDFQIIAGDILKAFGPSQIYNIEDITQPIILVYDENILTQIQNMDITGIPFYNSVYAATTRGMDYTVSATAFLQNGHNGVTPACLCPSNIQGWETSYPVDDSTGTTVLWDDSEYYINSNKDSISVGELLSYTRLKATNQRVIHTTMGNPASWAELQFCGTEIVSNMKYYYYNFGNPNNTNYIYGLLYTMIDSKYQGSLLINAFAVNDYAPEWTSVDYSPLIQRYILVSSSDSSTGYTIFYQGALWDFNNYAKVTNSNLANYHGYAVLGLMHVPQKLRESNAITIG